jgi:DNA-binding response OmpR family regulator
MRVLVIDSDLDACDAICDALLDAGHNAESVPDGDAALKALGRQPFPDLILLDVIASPDVAVYKRASGDARLASMPVVVLSASSFLHRSEFEKHIAQLVVLEKPFGINALMDALITAQLRTEDSFKGPVPPNSLVSPSAMGPVAEFLGVPLADAEELVKRMEDEKSWERGPGEEVALMKVHPGAHVGAENAFFVWIPEGKTYPLHGHTADEHKLLLRGGLRDDNGDQRWAGQYVTHGPEHVHASTAIGGGGCLLVAKNVPRVSSERAATSLPA